MAGWRKYLLHLRMSQRAGSGRLTNSIGKGIIPQVTAAQSTGSESSYSGTPFWILKADSKNSSCTETVYLFNPSRKHSDDDGSSLGLSTWPSSGRGLVLMWAHWPFPVSANSGKEETEGNREWGNGVELQNTDKTIGTAIPRTNRTLPDCRGADSSGAVPFSGTEGMHFLQPWACPASKEAIYSFVQCDSFMSQPTHFYEGPRGKAVTQSYTSAPTSVKYKQYKLGHPGL